MSAKLPAKDRFHNNAVEFLEFIASCIDELRSNKQTNYTPQVVDMAVGFLRGYRPDKLLTGFLDNYQYWDNICERNGKFILEEVPVLYKDVGLDVNIVICPYKVYKTNRDCCLTKDDMDAMWEYFEAMIGIACNYIHNQRQTDNKFRSEIDTKKYSEKLNFELKLDVIEDNV